MSLFATIAETRERHSDGRLQTPYYKANYATVKEAVKRLGLRMGYQVQGENDQHGELFLKSNRGHIIATIIQVLPTETAVDFKTQVYSMFGFKRPQKTIITMISKLKEELAYKGSGLHP